MSRYEKNSQSLILIQTKSYLWFIFVHWRYNSWLLLSDHDRKRFSWLKNKKCSLNLIMFKEKKNNTWLLLIFPVRQLWRNVFQFAAFIMQRISSSVRNHLPGHTGGYCHWLAAAVNQISMCVISVVRWRCRCGKMRSAKSGGFSSIAHFCNRG